MFSKVPDNVSLSPAEEANGNSSLLHTPAAFLPSEYIAYIVLGFIGILDNGLVVYVILHYKPMRKNLANLFIVNQSLLDMVASALFVLALDDRVHKRSFDGLLGGIYCKVWKSGALLWGCFIASTFNLTLTTLDRYLEIVHALWHRHHVTRTRAKLVMAAAWVAGLCYGLLYNASTSGMVAGVCLVIALWPNVMVARVAATFDFILPFILPVLVIFYSYSKMAYFIRLKVTLTASVETISNRDMQMQARSSKMRSNILRTLALVSTCYVICWTSNQVWFFLVGLGYPLDFNSRFYTFSVFAVYINCSINPIIYITSYGQFQKAVMWVIFKRRNPEMVTTTT